MADAHGFSLNVVRPWVEGQNIDDVYDLICREEDTAATLQRLMSQLSVAQMSQLSVAQRDAQLKRLSTEFEGKFRDPKDALQKLLFRLDKLREEADSQDQTTAVVSATSLIQSSGVGKSRCLVELAKMDVFVCYCSFQTGGGFPLRTPVLANRLQEHGPDDGEASCMAYLRAWMICIKKYCTGQLTFSTQGSSLCVEWTRNHVFKADGQVSDVIQAVLEEWDEKSTCTSQELQDALKEVSACLVRKVGVGLLFVFDEASVLFTPNPGCLSKAHFLKRALSHMVASALAVFVDTSAQLSVLAPMASEDRSLRIQTGEMHVLSPIWHVSNMNIFAPEMSNFSTLESLTAEEIFKFGRPLWGSWICGAQEGGKGDISKDVLNFAMRKLCGGVHLNEINSIKSGKGKPEVFMAVMGALLVLDVCPFSKLAVDLVANHLSIVLDISPDRRKVVTCEVWDPVVAEAAFILFREQDVRHAAINHLEQFVSNSLVDEGKNGELIARYILIRAVGEGRDRQDTVSLGNFLKKLLGETEIPEVTAVLENSNWRGKCSKVEQWLDQRLAVGKVNFSAFHPALDYTPGLSDLLEYFILRKAVICKSCQQRFDIVIPVLLPDEDGTFRLRKEAMSLLGMQVKSIMGNVGLYFNASTWMSPLGAGIVSRESNIPYATVLMQLADEKMETRYINNEGPSLRGGLGHKELQNPFIVYGLGRKVYSFLSDAEVASLHNMVHCRRNPFKELKDMEFARSVLPAALKKNETQG